MGTVGSPLVPAEGLQPGQGGRERAGFAVHVQGILFHLPPSFLLSCLPLFSPFVLCCTLCSQTQLCHLRLIGRMESGRLEEVLTNRLQWTGPPAERANLATRRCEGCAWYLGCCSLLRHSWDSDLAVGDCNGEGLRREVTDPHVGSTFWLWKSQGPLMLAQVPSPKGGSSPVLPSPPCPFLGWGQRQGAGMLMGTEPNLPRTRRSQPVTHEPLTTVVEWGGRGEMGSCRLQVGEVGKLEGGSRWLEMPGDHRGDE